MSKNGLSVIIITKNEEDRISRCLDSLKGIANEIIVFDSGSTDGTLNIVRQYTSFVYESDWPGYGIQKQRALDKASFDWVLSIDADEIVSEELAAEIRHIVDRSDESGPVGYCLPWKVVLYGKVIKFGRTAKGPLRFFRREKGRFTDSLVHEKVVLSEDRIGKLKGPLFHHSHRDFGHALKKSADYAWLGAQRKVNEERKVPPLIWAYIYSKLVFFKIYFLQRGFLDGHVGFIMAQLFAQNAFNKYAGFWLLKNKK